jgi:hypothetical protein
MSESMSYGSVSSVASRQCLQEFTVLCRSLQTSKREDVSSSELEDELGRFRVWLGNIGGVQKGHSSLEYRLREAPLVLESVLKLLRELSDALRNSMFDLLTGKSNSRFILTTYSHFNRFWSAAVGWRYIKSTEGW